MTRFQHLQTAFSLAVTIALAFIVAVLIKDRFFTDPHPLHCHLVIQAGTEFGLVCVGPLDALPRSS